MSGASVVAALPAATARALARTLAAEAGSWPSALALEDLLAKQPRRASLEIPDWLMECIAVDLETCMDRVDVAMEFYVLSRFVDRGKELCVRWKALSALLALVAPDRWERVKSTGCYMSTYSSSALARFLADNDGSVDVERAFKEEEAACASCEKHLPSAVDTAECVAQLLSAEASFHLVRIAASRAATLVDRRRRLDVCTAFRERSRKRVQS